nr:serine/threonine-protein kinase Nek11-like [Chrysemys picta bellii]
MGLRKVLKEISVGDLKPNETVEANLEAQLLSKLDHPAIVKFYASFVERESFCIITEYCEGRDLDCKIQEYKEAGKIFTESQIIEWFIQLLLGVNYMHERYSNLLFHMKPVRCDMTKQTCIG